MTHLIVCTHLRHDLARGAVASVKAHATDDLRVTVLDSSGTLLPWDGVAVHHVQCRQYGAQRFARQFYSRPGEVTVCIDDDVRLVARACLEDRYRGGWYKHRNGHMVMAWDDVCGSAPTHMLSQWRASFRCSGLPGMLCQYAAAANAEQIDDVWLHIDKGSQPETPERRALIDYLDHPRGLGDIVADGLAAIGITKERVQAVAAKAGVKDCGCKKRQAAMNSWANKHLGLPPGRES